jgi:hypothetical protein
MNSAAANGSFADATPSIKNGGGDVTIEGDTTNEKGIDLSGSAYAGSALNAGDTQTLNGHFGPYDQRSWICGPIRAGQLGDLRRSTLPFGDVSEILAVASTATKKSRAARRG